MSDVFVFALNERAGSKTPWRVRWRVGSRDVSRQFRTKAAAESFRSRLLVAVDRDEPFDLVTKLPRSWAQPNRKVLTCYDLAREFAQYKWPSWSANTRKSAVETLEITCRVLVVRPVPAAIQEAARDWLSHVALVPAIGSTAPLADRMRHDADKAAHMWLTRNSLPVLELTTQRAESVLDVFAHWRSSDRVTASTVVNRRRAQFGGMLRFGVRTGRLAADPLTMSGWKRPIINHEIDREVLMDPVRFRAVLDAVNRVGRSGGRYVAFFAVLYFAGLRPAEALALRDSDLELPVTGWGSIAVRRGLTAPGKRFTDDGAHYQERGLKWRAMGAVRHVPIPRELVTVLHQHLERYPLGANGLLFTNEAGHPMSPGRYARVFGTARRQVFPVGDPLRNTTPYDLRHANATLLLNADVPIAEVARRLGHSPDVLLSIYAGVMRDDETVANDRVEQFLAGAGWSWGSDRRRPPE